MEYIFVDSATSIFGRHGSACKLRSCEKSFPICGLCSILCSVQTTSMRLSESKIHRNIYHARTTSSSTAHGSSRDHVDYYILQSDLLLSSESVRVGGKAMLRCTASPYRRQWGGILCHSTHHWRCIRPRSGQGSRNSSCPSTHRPYNWQDSCWRTIAFAAMVPAGFGQQIKVPSPCRAADEALADCMQTGSHMKIFCVDGSISSD